jgi:hypothetical protein
MKSNSLKTIKMSSGWKLLYPDLRKVLNYVMGGMYALDFANLSNRFAFGGGDGIVSLFSINKASHAE